MTVASAGGAVIVPVIELAVAFPAFRSRALRVKGSPGSTTPSPSPSSPIPVPMCSSTGVAVGGPTLETTRA